jgi:hypothetical protein
MRKGLWAALLFLCSGLSAFAAGPTITNIAVASVTASGATITWTTSPAATGQIFYGLGASTALSSPLNGSLVTSHSITLSGLVQGQFYTYEVVSTDSGGSTTSATNTFTLCNPGAANPGMTNVTAQVNATYATGTLTAVWDNTSGVSTSTPTVCGNTFSTTQTATVGLPGNISMQLPDNNFIVPSPGKWTFTLSNASGLNVSEKVFGSSIDFTTAFGLQAGAGSPGGGVSSFFGNTGAITALADPTTVVDAAGNSVTWSTNGLAFTDKTGDTCTLAIGTITCKDANGDFMSLSDGVIDFEPNNNPAQEVQFENAADIFNLPITLPTPASSSNTNTAATTAYVQTALQSTVQVVTFTLTSSQILALNTTPVTVLPAKTGFIYFILQWSFNTVNTGANAYAGTNTIELIYALAPAIQAVGGVSQANSGLNFTGNNIGRGIPAAITAQASSELINSAVEIFSTTGSPTCATTPCGTLTGNIAYMLVAAQ